MLLPTLRNSLKSLSWVHVSALCLVIFIKVGAALFFWGGTDIPSWQWALQKFRFDSVILFNYYPSVSLTYIMPAYFSDWFGLPTTFYLKLQNVLTDFALAMLLFIIFLKQGHKERTSFWAALLFFINIPHLLITNFHGQNESVAILLIVVSIICFQGRKNSYMASGIFLSLAIGIKVFPLFVLPVFLIDRNTSWENRFYFGMGLATGTLLFMLPFAERPAEYLSFLQNPLTYKSHALLGGKQIILSIGKRIFGTTPTAHITIITGLGLVYLIQFAKKLSITNAIAGVFLATFVFSINLAPQYLMWPVFFLFVLLMHKTNLFLSSTLGLILISYYYYTPDNSGAYTSVGLLNFLTPNHGMFLEKSSITNFLNVTMRYSGLWYASLICLLGWFWGALKTKNIDPVKFISFRSKHSWVCLGIVFLLLGFSGMKRTGILAGVESLPLEYYRNNYFFYGKNYVLRGKLSKEIYSAGDRLKIKYEGLDIYNVSVNNHTLEKPFFIGKTFGPNHGGILQYKYKKNRLLTYKIQKTDTDRNGLNILILTNVASINVHTPVYPEIFINNEHIPVSFSSSRINQSGVSEYFNSLSSNTNLVESNYLEKESNWKFNIIHLLMIFLPLWAIAFLLVFRKRSS